MFKMFFFKLGVMALLALFCIPMQAQQLSTPQVFSSNMVFQQNRKVPLWGAASPDERITVSFAGQRIRTRANKEGHWKTDLQPMQATFQPQQLVIKGKDSTIIYDNILIGEVWLCSGQSNMAYKMCRGKYAAPAKGKDIASEELQKTINSKIRVFVVRRDGKPAAWCEAGGMDLAESSAAGYYFGKSIQEQLDVPVGIITSAVGGTRIEAWTSRKAYASSIFSAELEDGNGRIDGKGVGDLYDKMIAPLLPFAIKGFLWYQGESNITDQGKERRYAEKFQVLTSSWREAFQAPDASFYYVLLAPYLYSARNPKKGNTPSTAEELPIFWQQQIAMQTLIPNSDFINIWDMVDNIRDIHPSYKWKVGERLSRIALAKDYGKTDMEYSGPRLSKVKIINDSIFITFNHVAQGLKSRDRKRLNWFEVAGKDGIFRPALADIRDSNQVRVYHTDIKHPAKVRFGWHETAMPNLENSEKLPAVPFMFSTEK